MENRVQYSMDFEDPEQAELEVMKSLSLVEMLHVMQGGDVPTSNTPSPNKFQADQ